VVAAGETLSVPLVASAPDHPPLAVQELALVLDQVSVEEPPEAIVVGLAERVAVGFMPVVTVTLALVGALVPPAPVQVSV
jgi:hypothetical protein